MSSNSQSSKGPSVKIEEEQGQQGGTISGKWSDEQNLRYIFFLNKHRSKFMCRLRRRKIRLFEEMSTFLETRSAIQCRTHHQKYEHKYGQVKDIIKTFKEELGFTNLKNYAHLLQQLKNRPKMELEKKEDERKSQYGNKKGEGKTTTEIAIQTQPIPELPSLFSEQNVLQPYPSPTIATVWMPFFY